MAHRINIGVSTAGHRAIAGPLVVSAVSFEDVGKEVRLLYSLDNRIKHLETSDIKKLSLEQLHALRAGLLKKCVEECTWCVYPRELKMTPIKAAREKTIYLVVRRMLNRLKVRLDSFSYRIVINEPVDLSVYNLVYAIADDEAPWFVDAASVFAKIKQRTVFEVLHRHYPIYGWDTNLGHPTREHVLNIKRYGLTKHHRQNKE